MKGVINGYKLEGLLFNSFSQANVKIEIDCSMLDAKKMLTIMVESVHTCYTPLVDARKM